MGRQLQKKKNSSSIPKQSKHKNPRIFKVNPTGNALIAENWDRRQTLTQNYRRLGLISRLGKPTGGTEKPPTIGAASVPTAPETLRPGEARIERDPTGNITNIVYAKTAEEALDSSTHSQGEFAGCGGPVTDVVRRLEAQAAVGERKNRKTLCTGEMEWIGRLVDKHGDDFEGMARDPRLNVYQQSVGDIRRRVGIWERQRVGGDDA